MPGIYDLGSVGFQLPAFVDIEGSGVGATLIKGSGYPVISMTSSELRSLTVEARDTLVGIMVDGGSARFVDFRFNFMNVYIGMYTVNAEIVMNDGFFYVDGARLGLSIESNGANFPSADLNNVTYRLVSSGQGEIQAFYNPANVVFRNGKIEAPAGTLGINSGNMTIKDSEISYIVAHGTTIIGCTISEIAADPATRLSFSEVVGAVQPISGTGMRCFNNHDENLQPVVCP